jgi:hypothetical protein
MEHVAFSDSTMYKNLDGCTVRDFSPPAQGPDEERFIDLDITIDERFPKNGHITATRQEIFRVLNRSGHLVILTPEGEERTRVQSGSRVKIDVGERYAFEGSMCVEQRKQPIQPRDTGEYVEEN